jgi:hypothetical protein
MAGSRAGQILCTLSSVVGGQGEVGFGVSDLAALAFNPRLLFVGILLYQKLLLSPSHSHNIP